MWKSNGPQRVKAILSGCLQTATARMAKIIPVSVSPILTLDASHAAIGIVSLSGLMGLRFKPMAIDDAPIIGREIPFSRLSPHPLDYHPGAVTFVSCWEVAARAVTPLAISCDLRIPWIDNL